MKFKTLFLSMLGAAAIVSCNNDSVIGGPDGPDGPGGGESTTATFQFNFTKDPGSYAGDTDAEGTGDESRVDNAGLFIYKLDGTPEAMAYLASADYTDVTNGGKVTVKCKSGDKLIYVAVNIGGTSLIKYASTTSNATDPFLGEDWNVTGGTQGPKFFGVNGSLNPLNSAIWSKDANTIVIDSVTPIGSPTFQISSLGGSADGLIKALTGNGIPANGALSGNGGGNNYYLMSNWGDASTQPTDQVGSGESYVSTCKFNLKASVSAADLRGAVADYTNSNLKNAILINVQRAVAKISVNAITSGVQTAAGAGSSKGKFVPDNKWAIGNINTSEYPFQMWDGSIVRSTRYDDTARIIQADNLGWAKKMDNTRITGTTGSPIMSYEQQNLSASRIVGNTNPSTIFANSANQQWSTSTTTNYALVTENNQKNTLNHYTTFILFAGQYQPDSLITDVDNVGTITGNNGVFPTSWSGKDTIYYVGSVGSDGLFFWGIDALKKYVGYVLGVHSPSATPPYQPLTDQAVADYINALRVPNGDLQADLQAYWHGYCFYRVWISDDAASAAANKKLVRRNHVYHVTINKIKGPGIGDPNDIIDPDPSTIEPIEEADTYVTATVKIMKWHIINQGTDVSM
jgi:hypothetical protein